MKRIKKSNMKIIAATAMTIFSLFSSIVGAYAWFSGHLVYNQNPTDFSVTVLDGRLKNIYFHQHQSVAIDRETLKPTSYTFNSEYSGKISYDWQSHTATYTGDATISMDEYTPLDFSQPILMVFELKEAYSIVDAGEIIIRATTDVEGFLGARNSQNTPVYDLKTTGAYDTKPNPEDPTKTDYYYALSSVIDFYCNDSSSELYNKSGNTNTTLINATYNVSDLRTRETTAAEKEADPDAIVPDLAFTTIDNATDATSFNQRPMIYTARANTTVKYVSVIVDYYNYALDYIYSTYLGDDTLETEFEGRLNFLCDWGLEIG